MLVVIVFGLSWILVTRLSSANFVVSERRHNAKVLNQAKQALIGWVAMKAAEAGEDNPGRLPCPEAAGYYGDPAQEGIAAGSCTLPKVGRLPWRTLGLDKLVDAAGEPLWYAVSPGWAFTSSNLVINSNTPPGQLAVDGAANDSVALILAPGAAFAVPAAAGCGAWTQTRATSGTLDPRNYLECENATWTSFVTTGPSASFNDQVLKVTTADLLPAIEAAIAHRTEREIAPQLKSVYASAVWGLSSTNPLFPYAVPFSDPGTSNTYQGVTGTFQGLLPFNYSQSCNPATDSRCTTTFVNWNTAITPTVVQTSGVGALGPYSCTVTGTIAQCTGVYAGFLGPIQLQMSATASNVAMSLKQLDSTQTTIEYGLGFLGSSAAGSASGAFNGDGSAGVRVDGSFPDLLNASIDFRITANILVLADHTLLDPNNATTGWFVRNEWYRLAYYAVAPNHAASSTAPRSCSDSPLTCLNIVNLTPAGKQRAILILAGRSNPGQIRPSPSLAQYLEFGNATGAYERQPVSTALVAALKKPFNDRVVVIDANP